MAPPKKPASERHTTEIRLLLRPQDHELVKRAASLTGLSVSAWARLHLIPNARKQVFEAEREMGHREPEESP